MTNDGENLGKHRPRPVETSGPPALGPDGKKIVPSGSELWERLSEIQYETLAKQIVARYEDLPFPKKNYPPLFNALLKDIKTDLANIYYANGKSDILE